MSTGPTLSKPSEGASSRATGVGRAARRAGARSGSAARRRRPAVERRRVRYDGRRARDVDALEAVVREPVRIARARERVADAVADG